MTANSEFLLVVDTVTKEMMVESEIKCGSIQKNPLGVECDEHIVRIDDQIQCLTFAGGDRVSLILP